MKLKLAYKKLPSSDGGFVYTAMLNINIALPAKNSPRTKRFEALIDSGSTVCQFQADIGRAIGLNIEKGDPVQTLGISGPTTVYMHEISLYLPGGIVQTRAGFSDALPPLGILGMRGFFEYFRVTFDPTAYQCELERIYQA